MNDTKHHVVFAWDQDMFTAQMVCEWDVNDAERPCKPDTCDDGAFCNWVEWWANTDTPIKRQHLTLASLPVVNAEWMHGDYFEFTLDGVR